MGNFEESAFILLISLFINDNGDDLTKWGLLSMKKEGLGP